ncbi:SAVED domain-containing protein [Paenibacillus yanchengensis]|uniref:SAVED domain-containing protein n=1 Tax=Paenibacillus yanchengensis TaxID=2035833 RepID=A0ABW4YEZ3_9BACL
MAKKDSKDKSHDRRSLERGEVYHLWMVSGGICSFDGCSERLVANSKGKLTNVGVAAHIIGHSKTSARHEFAEQYGYTEDKLEDVRNLMLMCYKHSKLIDDQHTRDDFPPDLLFSMKQRHEAWVRGWTEDKKKSLAIVHKRLGPPMATLPMTEFTSNIMLEAIEDQTEFVDFTEAGWEKGKLQNEKLYKQFVDRIRIGKFDVAEVYSLSPIPLLIHLGKMLSDTIPLTVYQYERETGLWVNSLPEDKSLIGLNPSAIFKDVGAMQLVVTISVSDTVSEEDVQGARNFPHDRLDIRVENPHVKRLLYREQVQEIQQLFKDKSEELIRLKRYQHIHLFYSGPAGLAIELGRSINQNMWPEVSLYQFNYRNNPRYHFAFTV